MDEEMKTEEKTSDPYLAAAVISRVLSVAVKAGLVFVLFLVLRKLIPGRISTLYLVGYGLVLAGIFVFSEMLHTFSAVMAYKAGRNKRLISYTSPAARIILRIRMVLAGLMTVAAFVFDLKFGIAAFFALLAYYGTDRLRLSSGGGELSDIPFATLQNVCAGVAGIVMLVACGAVFFIGHGEGLSYFGIAGLVISLAMTIDLYGYGTDFLIPGEKLPEDEFSEDDSSVDEGLEEERLEEEQQEDEAYPEERIEDEE